MRIPLCVYGGDVSQTVIPLDERGGRADSDDLGRRIDERSLNREPQEGTAEHGKYHEHP